ncbi:MAG: MBL fold metallo-hydrolase, partial [Candidatus Diapherotrites archaeon]|nr:MBL fold metallo-hydrolase [Candidatus Diapherotrites archaeon]
MANITFFGACSEVGRNAMLLEASGKKILCDAGIKVGKEKNEYPDIPKGLAKKIDAIVLTHAHIDHCGYIPFLVKQGFKGKVFATNPTRDIMHLLLSDAAKIARENKTEFYNTQDIEKTLSRAEAISFGEKTKIANGIELVFYNAGHILGSSLAVLGFEGKKLLYAGDLNTRESNLLLPAKPPQEKIDFLVLEST